ncbi:hypothetical protein V7794_05070 [Rhizobium laguerreae]
MLERHNVVDRTMEPTFILVGMQQDRHAIMNRRDGFVGVGHRAGIDCHHSSLTRHSPPQAKIRSPFKLNHFRVFLPVSPSASANLVTGIRFHWPNLKSIKNRK